ncbi:hypothetical protein K8I61_17355 [bacterium]|nr:hypothetical protein [bacterium]
MPAEQPEHTHQLEFVSLDKVARYQKNPKAHNLTQIRASIARHGFIAPLLRNDSTGELLAGHGRLDALMEMRDEGASPPEGIRVDPNTGNWLAPVISGIALDEQDHASYVLADNRLVELGGWDDDLLRELLESLESGEGMAGTGFSDSDLRELLDEGGAAAKDQTAVDRPRMDLQPFEHFDYVVLMYRDVRDFMRAQELLGVKRVDASVAAGKRKKIGLGRVVDGRKLFALVEGHHVEKPTGDHLDAPSDS